MNIYKRMLCTKKANDYVSLRKSYSFELKKLPQKVPKELKRNVKVCEVRYRENVIKNYPSKFYLFPCIHETFCRSAFISHFKRIKS